MAVESKHFIFNLPRVIYEGSKELGTASKPRIAVGLLSVTVGCKACAHVWHARERGEGSFEQSLDPALTFTCPSCSVQEAVPSSNFY
jgi:hypothetical protein